MVEQTLDACGDMKANSLDEILEADRKARELALAMT